MAFPGSMPGRQAAGMDPQQMQEQQMIKYVCDQSILSMLVESLHSL